jgi:hypothetical protein
MLFSTDGYFGKRARKIGEELVHQGGGNALFTCMNMLVEELLSNYRHLRELVDIIKIVK